LEARRKLVQANRRLLEAKRRGWDQYPFVQTVKYAVQAVANAQKDDAAVKALDDSFSLRNPSQSTPSSSSSSSSLKSLPKQSGGPVYQSLKRENGNLVASVTPGTVLAKSFAKKQKRFQMDSPSAPNRKLARAPIVDLCSSGEDSDVEDEDKADKAPKNPLSRKDSPLKNENNESSNKMPTKKVPTMVGADASTTGSENLKRKASPEVNLCTSSDDDDDDADDDDDDDESLRSNDQDPRKLRKQDSLAIGDKDPKVLPEIGDAKRSSIGNVLRKLRVPTNSKPVTSWKDFSQDLAKRKAELLDMKNMISAAKRIAVATAGMETTGRSSSFDLPSVSSRSFSTERKRELLTTLRPDSLTTEIIKGENWKVANYLSISKAFAERFGNLDTEELERLALGEKLVPKGMVSIAFVHKEKTLGANIGEEHNHPTIYYNESQPTGNEGRNQSEVSDESEGSFDRVKDPPKPGAFVKKDEKNDNEAMNAKTTAPDDYEGGTVKTEDPKEADFFVEAEENKSKTNGDDEDGAQIKNDSEEANISSVGNDETEGIRADEIKAKANDDIEGSADGTEKTKDVDESLRKDEKESNGVEETNFKAHDDHEGSVETTESPNEVNETSKKDEQGNGVREADLEKQDDTQGDLEKTESPKQVDETTENTIVEYQEDEKSHRTPDGGSSTIIQDGDHEQREDRGMAIITLKQLVILILPLICISGIFRRLGLFDISNSILEGCFRTLLQLHILGSLLSPIFKYGVKHPVLVICYALFMVVLASYEASSRTRYTHDNHFTIIVQSMVLVVSWVAIWAFGAILKPRPRWNPRYVLPIVGMLLGNSINGISITLDSILTSLVERQSEIDLYLSFGADKYEAVSGIIAHAIQKGTTPSLNMMCVVGIVSIPGMMTGQILGGSSPMAAARYQAMIIFLIALTTMSTIMCSSYLTVMSAFSSHQLLMPERFVKNHKRRLAQLILWVWGYVFGSGSDVVPVGSATDGKAGSLLTEDELDATLRPTVTGFEIRPLKKGLVAPDEEGRNGLIQVSGLNRYFEVGGDVESDRRVLFQDLSFGINEGDLLFVSGPSGTGKSQLLRMVAGLSPLQDGTMRLQGMNWEDYDGNGAVQWRRQIRYVTQTKVQISGTPFQFIKKILSFRSWKAVDDRNHAVIEHDFMKHVSHHIRQWGMGRESLNKEWSVLSGGESQRMLMAIALASRPKILLFDESTSALDHESKLAVETSIKDFVEDHEGGVLWVSHDEQQAGRMMDYDGNRNGSNNKVEDQLLKIQEKKVLEDKLRKLEDDIAKNKNEADELKKAEGEKVISENDTGQKQKAEQETDFVVKKMKSEL